MLFYMRVEHLRILASTGVLEPIPCGSGRMTVNRMTGPEWGRMESEVIQGTKLQFADSNFLIYSEHIVGIFRTFMNYSGKYYSK